MTLPRSAAARTGTDPYSRGRRRLTVWSGRALQEVFVDLVVSGLASMYPVSSWSCFAPDHHGYQRACDLINGPASTGHLGHQCSHAPGRPILHLFLFLSQTSAGSSAIAGLSPECTENLIRVDDVVKSLKLAK